MPARKQPIGLVTGPRPGLAICSFVEGIVETVLRCAVAVGCVCAVGIWCSVAVLSASYRTADSSNASEKNSTLPAMVDKSSTLGLTAAGVGLAWELAVIAVRFLNIGILNMMSRMFLATDITAHIIMIALFSSSLVLGSLSTSSLLQYPAAASVATDAVLGSTLAAMVMSGVMVIVTAVLIVWLVLFISYNWTTHIITYTIKAELLV